MTIQSVWYKALIEELPQLAPYTSRDRWGNVYVGPDWGNISAKAISVWGNEYTIDARWKPAPYKAYHEYILEPDTVMNQLKLHADEILKMIQDFEKTANPEEELDCLKGLGFEQDDYAWELDIDDLIIRIISPYDDSVSSFSWELKVWEDAQKCFDEYFGTLDELLDYIVDGVRYDN